MYVDKVYFSAGKTATETVQMVHGAYGDEALMWSLVWMVSWRAGRGSRQPQEWLPLWVSSGWQHWKNAAAVAVKSSPVTLNDSGWAWHRQGYWMEDCHWKKKKESLLALFTAHIDWGTEGRLNCCISRFDWDCGQWSHLL